MVADSGPAPLRGVPRGLLARNMAFNVAGGLIPPLLGTLTIPYVLGSLGVERFGVLALAWAAMNYFTAFDVGLGRTTLKYTAEALGSGREKDIPAIVGTTLFWQLAFSSLGAVLLGVVLPTVLEWVVKIPPDLVGETKEMFQILGASIPVVVCALALRRVVEGAQRFDLATLIRIPAQTSLFWAPAIAAFLGYRLPGVAVLLLVAQVISLVAYAVAAGFAIPILRRSIRIDRRLNRRLLSYGGWVTVSAMVTPAMSFLDRFMVGSLVSVAAVAFYAVPFEALMRVNYILPSCLGATLFPAFSALGLARRDETERLYVRGVRYMLVAMGLLALLLVLLARDLLLFWLGPEFAQQSTSVFQWLAVGFFLSGMAWLPTTLLQSMDRPDLVSKLFVLELVIYLPLAWVFIRWWGIEGAAYAMVARCVFEITVLLVAPRAAMLLRAGAFRGQGVLSGSVLVVTLTTAALVVARSAPGHRVLHVGATAAILITFASVAWFWVLNGTDRQAFVDLVRRAKRV